MENNEIQIYHSQVMGNKNTPKINTKSIMPACYKDIPNKEDFSFNVNDDNLLTPEEHQRFQKIMGSIDFINEDLSNILENPFNKEDQERIEKIMNDSGKRGDSCPIKSSLELNIDARKMERIRAIDRLLEEMKADGHAYNKNIASSKCKSKNARTMKTLDELKAEMNKIEESLENSRKNRKVQNHLKITTRENEK